MHDARRSASGRPSTVGDGEGRLDGWRVADVSQELGEPLWSDVMIAEPDLTGPLSDLVTAVLAKGDPV